MTSDNPVTSKKYDVLVFGATGFTGQRIAHEVATTFNGRPWAIAGRDKKKLEALAGSLETRPAIVTADVADQDSLNAMASLTIVLINCVGPFRFWGEPVVKACIQGKAHYLDISGEPEVIETIELKYHDQAAHAGCYVASAVGFDSVPCDVGVLWTAQQFKEPSICTFVESFLTIKSGPQGARGHFPTWESAVHGIASAEELSKVRRQAKTALHREKEPPMLGMKPPRHTGPHYEKRLGAYTLPFIGADASVLRRTMWSLAAEGRPVTKCAVYLTIPNLYYLVLFLLFGTLFKLLALRRWGRRLLLMYPDVFSFGMFPHAGPTEQQMQQTSFHFTNIAVGYSSRELAEGGQTQPDIQKTTMVKGPEPGYIACSIFIVAAALTLLEEPSSLPPSPGVYTPARLLMDTTYVQRLMNRGITFEITENPVLSK